jgi:N-acylglucosamine 2-epimerase
MRSPDSPAIPAAAELQSLAEFYLQHLTRDVLGFWAPRVLDSAQGGYFQCFDRAGNRTADDKYVWMQGRNLWMYSALYRRLERRPEWLLLAEAGRDFLVRHAYAGEGRWFYQLDRAGNARRGTISIYTDHFVLAGLCEYAAATGLGEDLDLIETTYDAIERNTFDPGFKDIFHGVWHPGYQRHGIYMIGLHVAGVARLVLGESRTRPLIDECLYRILHVFAKDDRRLLFESLSRSGEVVDEPEGRVVNPGHALESMWFCMEEGLYRGDRKIVERASEIAGWMYAYGRDPVHGGLFAFRDASGEDPRTMDWHKETEVAWSDKVWWVHSEALYALALAALETNDAARWAEFVELHQWCMSRFPDREFGEWYPVLHRDGSPKITDKGGEWKAVYHLPRALLLLNRLFHRRVSA